WIIIAAAIIGIGGMTTQKKDEDNFTTPIESQTGQHLIEKHFGEDANASEMIIVRSERHTVDDPAFRQVVEGTIANLAPFGDDIASVVNYYDAPDSLQTQALVSDDGHALLMPVSFNKAPIDLQDAYKDYDAAIDASRADGFSVYSAGDITFNEIGEMVNE